MLLPPTCEGDPPMRRSKMEGGLHGENGVFGPIYAPYQSWSADPLSPPSIHCAGFSLFLLRLSATEAYFKL